MPPRHPSSSPPGARPPERDASAELVNQLTQELTQLRRELAQAEHKALIARRAMHLRVKELGRVAPLTSVLRQVLDASDTALVACLPDRCLWNAAFARLWGLTTPALETEDHDSLMAALMSLAREPRQFLEEMQVLEDTPHSPRRVALQDGRVIEVESLHTPAESRQGRVLRWRQVKA